MFTCKVDKQGRITLPVDWRKTHHIEPGSEVAVVVGEDRLEVQTGDQSLDEARLIVSRYRTRKHSTVDALREERRRGAAREQAEAGAHGKRI